MMRTKFLASLLPAAGLALLLLLLERRVGRAPGDLDPDTIIVSATARGVTLVRDTFTATVARQAVSDGLAAWSIENGKKLLRLTDAGRAFLRRDAVGDQGFLGFRFSHGG